jgi:hypothetical protein
VPSVSQRRRRMSFFPPHLASGVRSCIAMALRLGGAYSVFAIYKIKYHAVYQNRPKVFSS